MRYRERLSRIFWEVIFPEDIYCIGCGDPVKKGSKYSLCSGCREELLLNQPENCMRCGRFVKKRETVFCEYCGASPPEYDRASAAVVYNEKARKIVYDLKYAGKGYLAKNVAAIMRGSVENLGDHDIMIPVPMHKDKQKTRGFCQTTLICERLSEDTGIPLVKGKLVRARNTKPMSGLEPLERKKNIRDAFSVTGAGEISGKRILLIDDLLTTGSTADECSRILKNAGAEKVSLAVFAAPYKDNKN